MNITVEELQGTCRVQVRSNSPQTWLQYRASELSWRHPPTSSRRRRRRRRGQNPVNPYQSDPSKNLRAGSGFLIPLKVFLERESVRELRAFKVTRRMREREIMYVLVVTGLLVYDNDVTRLSQWLSATIMLQVRFVV